MAQTHRAVPGDYVAKIAARYGFDNPQTIWEHPKNEGLRRRRNPNTLRPGDLVFIPDKEERGDARNTGQRHDFTVNVLQVELHLRLLDSAEQPFAFAPFSIRFPDRRVFTGMTDGDGVIHFQNVGKGEKQQGGAEGSRSHFITTKDEEATLTLGAESAPLARWNLKIGHLPPVDLGDGAAPVAGARARLANLGYPGVPADGDTADASDAGTWNGIREFQRTALKREKPDGKIDAETADRLRKEHGV